MSDLNDLIATNAKVAFNQGVTRENERIVRVLRENLLPDIVTLVTDDTQSQMSPTAHIERETMQTENRTVISRSQRHYIDGMADGFDRAIKTVSDFSNSIYDTRTVYDRDTVNYGAQKQELEIAMNTLEALREMLEDTSDIGLDLAAKTYKPENLTELTEDEWSEIDRADDLTKSLLQLISRYKSEGYVAVTLDKVARLVIGGHAGFIYGEE